MSLATGPTVMADAVRLQQVFGNLVSNAIKYTPTGGRILVTADPDEEAGGWVVEVTDTGVGISPDELPRVFEPFFRAAGSAGQRGTGLGLAVTRPIVVGHDGTIEVESEPGEGTTMTVRIPFEKE